MIVLGAGVWGMALSFVLAKKNKNVLVWDHDPALLTTLEKTRKHPRLPGSLTLPENIQVCKTLNEEVFAKHDVLVVVPSYAFEVLMQTLKPLLTKETSLIWATKGLSKSGEFLYNVALDILGENQGLAVLSGPSFALEVAQDVPTAVMIASPKREVAENFRRKFSTPHFQVFTTDDMVGVQLGGVLKNVLAVMSGLSDGLKFGSNTRAALITRGMNEMMALGKVMNARPETLMGLAGLGDMILTCTDDQSRNRRFGLALGQGQSESEILDKIGESVEAVYNVDQVCKLGRSNHVPLPIAEQVFRVIKQQVSPREAILTLFAS